MYEIKTPSSVKKDIKRLDKPVQKELRDKHFPKIKESPFDAKPLRGNLKGLWASFLPWFRPVPNRLRDTSRRRSGDAGHGGQQRRLLRSLAEAVKVMVINNR
jgi:hypothetical protein